ATTQTATLSLHDALPIYIAKYGNMKASFMDTHDAHAHDQIKALVIANNQVNQVSTKQPFPSPNIGKNVVVIDLGLKNTVLRELRSEEHTSELQSRFDLVC